MNNGYILIWRKFWETSFFKDSYAVHLAILLLMKANHSDQTFIFNGQEMTIKRGSCIIGRNSLALETGIKPSTVRNKLHLLRNAKFMDSQSNNKFSIITIMNYERYQNPKSYLGQQKGQPEDSQRTARGQQKDTNNKCNNEKNGSKEAPTTTLGGLILKNSFLENLKTTYPMLNVESEVLACIAWHKNKNSDIKSWDRAIRNWLKISYEKTGVVGGVPETKSTRRIL